MTGRCLVRPSHNCFNVITIYVRLCRPSDLYSSNSLFVFLPSAASNTDKIKIRYFDKISDPDLTDFQRTPSASNLCPSSDLPPTCLHCSSSYASSSNFGRLSSTTPTCPTTKMIACGTNGLRSDSRCAACPSKICAELMAWRHTASKLQANFEGGAPHPCNSAGTVQ